MSQGNPDKKANVAKSKPTYYDLLRHPNWQRKRLEVMQRAEFRCEKCDTADDTLNVHHRYYEKGKKPWEYPDDCFRCLCERCHHRIHELLTTAKRQLELMDDNDLMRAAGYLRLRSANYPGDIIQIDEVECVEGMADYLGVRMIDLIRELDDGMTFQEVLDLGRALRAADRAKK